MIARVAQAFGHPPAALTSGTRARPVAQARAAGLMRKGGVKPEDLLPRVR